MKARFDNVFGTLAFALLVLAIAAVPVLLFLTVRSNPGKVTVGRFSAASCPTSGNVRCYSAVVTNTGTRSTAVACSLLPEGGPLATFLNDTTRYVSGGLLAPGSSVELLIKLHPNSGASPALPVLRCEPA